MENSNENEGSNVMDEVASMSHEELRAYVAKYKDTYDKMRKYSLQL